jgi:hypothetical protein
MTETAAVLDAIDEALARGDAVAAEPELRELQELALALRDDAPEPDRDFAAELDARLAAGFPRARTRPRLTLPRLPRPALAAAASVLLALAVVAGLLTRGDEDSPEPTALSDTRAAAPESAPQADEQLAQQADELLGGGASDAAGGAALPEGAQLRAGPLAPGERERKIVRDAQLTIGAPADELARIGDQVVAITDRHRGFVLSSSLTTGEDGATGGQYELRIPQQRLRAAIRDLSALGTVESRSEQGEDITPSFSRTEERLQEARAERRGLLRRLESAQSDQEADAIRRRLRLVSAEIRRLQGRLERLEERVDYAAVSVTLTERDDADRGGGGANGGTREALDDALGSLVGAVNLGLRILGVALPLGLVGGAAWLAARILRRRRREAALG